MDSVRSMSGFLYIQFFLSPQKFQLKSSNKTTMIKDIIQSKENHDTSAELEPEL